jgi:hypothetical protein
MLCNTYSPSSLALEGSMRIGLNLDAKDNARVPIIKTKTHFGQVDYDRDQQIQAGENLDR